MTLEFRCADVGLECHTTVRADSEEELVERIGVHARDDHQVDLNQTLIDYARSRVSRR